VRIFRSQHTRWFSGLLGLAVLSALCFQAQTATAANPNLISFQGKVVNADGTNVANGAYNFDFVLYDDPTLGTPSDGVHDKWHELTKSVTVTSGVFQTNLGSATALPDFNANPSLYLAVRFNADAAGYMTPRVQMTSAPYALNADKVGGVAASSIVQLGATQSGNINISSGTITSGLINGQTINTSASFTGTLSVAGASSLALGTASTNDGSIIFRSSGGANTVTLQAPSTNPGSSYALKLPITAPALGECLQNDGTTIGQLVFASCAAGGGDNITVNGSLATDANFLNTVASASVAGTTFALNTGATPDAITLTVSDASATVSGVVTANAQTIGGLKTFDSGIAITGGDLAVTQPAGSDVLVSASAATTVDQFVITNASGATSTTGIDGASINFNTAGTTASADNAGLRIDVTSNNSGTSTTLAGLKIGDLSSAEANATETAISVGTGWDIGLDIQSGSLQLATVSTEPASPTTGNLRVYAKEIAGRVLLKIKGPSGLDTSLQPAIFFNSIATLLPSGAATPTLIGMPNTVVGTAAAGTLATTNMRTSTRRTQVTSAATANSASEFRAAVNMFWRGNAAGLGGFFTVQRFAVNSTVTNQRVFVGLMGATTATSASAAPSSLTNIIGVGWDSADTSLQIMHNDASGTATKVSLGATFPSNNNTIVYELVLFAPSNGSSVGYRLKRLDTDQDTSGSITTDLPANTTFLTHHEYMNNGGTASAVILDVISVYLESDT
jgi:hypothetical protein